MRKGGKPLEAETKLQEIISNIRAIDPEYKISDTEFNSRLLYSTPDENTFDVRIFHGRGTTSTHVTIMKALNAR